MEKRRWIYPAQHNNRELEKMAEYFNADIDIIRILFNRGFTTRERISDFLSPDLSKIRDPFSMSDMECGVSLLLDAVKSQKNIWVYGDYDVDGVTSASLFVLAMRKIGYSVNYYIPLREEGYGLNIDAVSTLKASGCDVIVTVDCGISSHKEINYARELGMTVIITDHHEITSTLPEADAVINPKRPDNIYPYKYLAGCGTIFMLILALYKKLGKYESAFEFLDIVTIGTVADIVPLTEENRIFVSHGIKMLNSAPNYGLRTLIEKIFNDFPTRNFNTRDIGFRIAPAFNAAGRLEDAKKGVELLLSTSENASIIAGYLIEKNSERQNVEKEILEAVETYISQNELYNNPVIIASGKNFHHGVIGIVASRIIDRYYKPSIILEEKEDGTCVASARSIEGFSIISALESMAELFIKFGGHDGAAGFSIKKEHLDEFISRMIAYASLHIAEDLFSKPIRLESALPVYKVSFDFYDKLSLLAPYGFGNPSPLFSLNGARIINAKSVGEDKTHLRFDVEKNGIVIKGCMWFSNASFLDELEPRALYDIAMKIDLNYYNERYSPQLMVDDIRASSSVNESAPASSLYFTSFPVKAILYSKLDRRDFSGAPVLAYDTANNVYSLKIGQRFAGWLSSELSLMLRTMADNWNWAFSCSIDNITEGTLVNGVSLSISRNNLFSTMAISDGQIFSNIKEFLIGDFEYNAMQKSALAGIIRNNKKINMITHRGRGIKTLILSIALINYTKYNKKTFVLSDIYSFKGYEYCIDASVNPDGYSAGIHKSSMIAFSHKVSNQMFTSNLPDLIISFDHAEFSGYENIVDKFVIPSNVRIDDSIHGVNAKEGFDYEYHTWVTLKEKSDFIKKMKQYKIISSCREILALL